MRNVCLALALALTLPVSMGCGGGGADDPAVEHQPPLNDPNAALVPGMDPAAAEQAPASK